MPEVLTGSASIDIRRPADEVFTAIADLERMGEWSPESGEVRWLDGATSAALGVRFAGDNEVRLGPIPVKRWTTQSEITAFDAPHVLEFVAGGATTWRFELVETNGVTTVTETFAFEQVSGFQKLMYNALGSRDAQMVAGMERTLAAMKRHLEAA